MARLNEVRLIGNVVRKGEVKFLPSGTALYEFPLAVNDRIKRGDVWEDDPSFFDVKVFGKAAEACATYLEKGVPVFVSGRLKQDRWEKEGKKQSRVQVIAHSVQFLGKKKSEDPPPQDDDIPF